MGWTFQHRTKGMSNKEFFTKEFGYTNDSGSSKIVDCANVGSTVYLILETKRILDTIKLKDSAHSFEIARIAVVCLTKRNTHDDMNFGYKDMDENCGPIESECPKRLLDMLTETNNKYALEWRKRCYENARIKASKQKLYNGCVVEFAEPIDYRRFETRYFYVESTRKPKRILANGNTLVQFPARLLKSRDYNILTIDDIQNRLLDGFETENCSSVHIWRDNAIHAVVIAAAPITVDEMLITVDNGQLLAQGRLDDITVWLRALITIEHLIKE